MDELARLIIRVDALDAERAAAAQKSLVTETGKAETAIANQTTSAKQNASAHQSVGSALGKTTSAAAAEARAMLAATQAQDATNSSARALAATTGGTLTRALDNAGSAAGRTAGSGIALKGALGGIAAALSVRELANYADAATNLANRLRLVTTGEADRVATAAALFDISKRTRSDAAATAELYVKLRQSNDALNLSTTQTQNVTEAFALALKASGADAATATGAIRQFAQAMASGALKGDEFVTISEAAPVVLQLLQKDLGKTRAELMAMKEAGELTGGMIAHALLKNLDSLRTSAAASTSTIADGFTSIRNSIVKTVGASSDMATASKNVAQGLAGIGTFIEDNGPILGQLVKMTAFAFGATKAIQGMTAAIAALNAASLASLAARLGPLVAVLAPFAGFAARGMRDASDAQDREDEVSRLSALSPTQLGTLSAGNERSQAAIVGRRRQIAGLTGADRSAAQDEDVRLNRRYNELRDEYGRLRDAAGGIAASAAPGVAPQPATQKPVPGTTRKPAGPDAITRWADEQDGIAEMTRRAVERARDRTDQKITAAFDSILPTGTASLGTGGVVESRKSAPDKLTSGADYSDVLSKTKAVADDAQARSQQIAQAFANSMQTAFASGLEDLATRGLKSFGAFFDSLKALALRTFSEIGASKLMGTLTASMAGRGEGAGATGGDIRAGLSRVVSAVRSGGTASPAAVAVPAAAVPTVATPRIQAVPLGGKVVGSIMPAPMPALAKLARVASVAPMVTATSAPSSGTGIASVLDLGKGPSLGGVDKLSNVAGKSGKLAALAPKVMPGLAVAGIGLGLGNALGEQLGGGKGAAAGALAGAASGAVIGSMVPVLGTAIGGIIGGAAGLIGGIFGGKKKKEAAQQLAVAAASAMDDLAIRSLAASGQTDEAEKRRLIQAQKREAEEVEKQFTRQSDVYRELMRVQAAERAKLTDTMQGELSAGTYLAPDGFSANNYRFNAGRPSSSSSSTVTITEPTIVVPPGTTAEQARAILAEFGRLAGAQGLPQNALPYLT